MTRRYRSTSERRHIDGAVEAAPSKTFVQKLLDSVIGNRVPDPAVIFFILSGLVIVLSHLFYLLGTSVANEVVNPQTHQVEHATATVKSLLSADGIRFMLTSMVRNFINFGPVGIILVVMTGVGLAEQAGQASSCRAGGGVCRRFGRLRRQFSDCAKRFGTH